MPNIKSQKDRVVQAAAEQAHNKAIKTNLKTVVKRQTLPSMLKPLTRTQLSWLLFPRSTRLALRVSSRRTPLLARSAVWPSVQTRTPDLRQIK